MGIRGAKPQPTNLRLLHGNPGKRPLPTHEPKPKERAPRCAPWMSKAAKREWAYIVPKLAKLRIVTELDRAVLESYCSAYGRWRETEEVLKDEPSILRVVTERAEDGTALKSYVTQNPLLAVANRARKQMHEALAELGLSPSSRTRVMTMDRGSADDPFGIL